MTIIKSEYEAIVDTQSRWLLLVIKGFSLGAWAVFFFFFFWLYLEFGRVASIPLYSWDEMWFEFSSGA